MQWYLIKQKLTPFLGIYIPTISILGPYCKCVREQVCMLYNKGRREKSGLSCREKRLTIQFEMSLPLINLKP